MGEATIPHRITCNAQLTLNGDQLVVTMPIPPAASDVLDASNFKLWLQSDKPNWPALTLPADADPIDPAWNDTTGRNNHGTPPTAAGHSRFDENIQNGLPGIFFDANNLGDPSFDPCDRVRFPDDALVDLPEGEAFFALKLLADPPTNGLFSGLWQFNRLSPGAGSRTSYCEPTTGHCVIAFGGAQIDIGVAPVALNRAHILNVTASPSEMTIRFNGIVVHTEDGTKWNGFPNIPAGSAFSTLGGDSDAFNSLMGWGFEFIIESPVPTSVRRAATHSYISTKLAIPLGIGLVEAFLVGGGAPGGNVATTANSYSGAGGGGGRVLHRPKRVLAPGSYPVVVGAGGVPGANGGDTSFDDLVAIGGGKGAEGSFDGGGGFPNNNGSSGGSGGGGSRGGSGGTGSGVPASQGSDGGAGDVAFGSSGSGGGANAAGTHSGSNNGAAGGDGVANSISGASVKYGAGGASGGYGAPGGTGGDGGGGDGGGDRLDGSPGTDGTGSGGGGAGSSAGGAATTGGEGGDGTGIIKYVTTAFGANTGGTITTDGIYTIHTFAVADNGTPTNDFVVVAP